MLEVCKRVKIPFICWKLLVGEGKTHTLCEIHGKFPIVERKTHIIRFHIMYVSYSLLLKNSPKWRKPQTLAKHGRGMEEMSA